MTKRTRKPTPKTVGSIWYIFGKVKVEILDVFPAIAQHRQTKSRCRIRVLEEGAWRRGRYVVGFTDVVASSILFPMSNVAAKQHPLPKYEMVDDEI